MTGGVYLFKYIVYEWVKTSRHTLWAADVHNLNVYNYSRLRLQIKILYIYAFFDEVPVKRLVKK